VSPGPRYWMASTGPVRRAVMAYLQNTEFKPGYLEALREYCRQWIWAEVWDKSPHMSEEDRAWLTERRAEIDFLDNREALARWLRRVAENEMDPL
jgi:hypothetical protein